MHNILIILITIQHPEMLWTHFMVQPFQLCSYRQDKPGTDREPIHIVTNTANNKSVFSLPAEYSEVSPVPLPRTELLAPVSEGPAKVESTVMAASKEKEDDWLSAMSELVLKKDKLGPKDFVSWAAYHADRQSGELSLLS